MMRKCRNFAFVLMLCFTCMGCSPSYDLRACLPEEYDLWQASSANIRTDADGEVAYTQFELVGTSGCVLCTFEDGILTETDAPASASPARVTGAQALGFIKAALNAMPRAERSCARVALLCVSEETVLSAPEGAMLYSFASDASEVWDGAALPTGCLATATAGAADGSRNATVYLLFP